MLLFISSRLCVRQTKATSTRTITINTPSNTPTSTTNTTTTTNTVTTVYLGLLPPVHRTPHPSAASATNKADPTARANCSDCPGYQPELLAKIKTIETIKTKIKTELQSKHLSVKGLPRALMAANQHSHALIPALALIRAWELRLAQPIKTKTLKNHPRIHSGGLRSLIRRLARHHLASSRRLVL